MTKYPLSNRVSAKYDPVCPVTPEMTATCMCCPRKIIRQVSSKVSPQLIIAKLNEK
jgi:hypothetical protein